MKKRVLDRITGLRGWGLDRGLPDLGPPASLFSPSCGLRSPGYYQIFLDLGRMMVIVLIQDDKKMGKKFGKNL
jgi:hypothetical protein